MSSTRSDRERLERVEGALLARCDAAWVLLVLSAASAVAARLEPLRGSVWDWAAVIAAGASALAGAAALGARHERNGVLDAMLIVAPLACGEGPAARRARRIGSPRARMRTAARLDALVVRARRGGRGECFQTGLVRVHAVRLRAIAVRLRASDPPVSALARIHRLLIEIDLGTPVSVSSRRALDRSQARSDRGGAALLRTEPARGRVPGQADGRGRRLRREGADAGGRHRR